MKIDETIFMMNQENYFQREFSKIYGRVNVAFEELY